MEHHNHEMPMEKNNTPTAPQAGGKSASLSLYGMDCASCAAIIQKSLQKAPGVSFAQVNFAAEKATVRYDETKTTEDELVKAVERAGYKAKVLGKQKDGEEEAKRAAAILNFQKKFAWGALLSAPMLYFMLLDFFKFLPGAYVLLPYVGVISFVLSTPVQFIIGRNFYKGLWSGLKMRSFNMDSLIAIGTSAAYFYSLAQFADYVIKKSSLIAEPGQKIPELYFETAAFLITFVLFGKWLEPRA